MRLIILLLVCYSASAATICMDPSATGGSGTKSGADWNNVADFTASMTRGNTYYIRDGVHSGSINFSVGVSGTTLITVKKATVADHGTATGWLDTMGDGVLQIVGQTAFLSDYWVFDGQVGGGPVAWTNGFGILCDASAVGSFLNAIQIADGVNNITIRHVEQKGHGPDNDANDQDNLWMGTGSGPVTLSYIYSHDAGRCIVFTRKHSVTFEYWFTGKYQSTPGQHAELTSMWIDFSNTSVTNNVYRWSIFTHAEGTGGIISDSDGLQVYGCVFAPLNGGTLTGYGNGLIGTWTSDICKNIKIYNNTFIGSERVLGLFENASDTGNIFKNNLIYNATAGNDSSGLTSPGMTHTHNYYISISDGPITEATQQTGSSNPFVDWPNLNFALNSNSTAGTSLGSPYDVDMNGTTRTTWTRGAIEFVAGSNPGALALTSSAQTVSENVGSVQFTVSRSGGSSGAVGISYATGNGTATAPGDYTTTSGTLTWANGDTANKTITIPIIDDSTVESTESFSLILSSPTGGATLGSPSTASVTITDNDTLPPAISVSPSTAQTFTDTDVNQSRTLSFTVSNTGGGTLSGSVTGLSAPFSIVSGSPYSIGGGGNQVVTIRFSPTAVGAFSQTAAFSGGAGASRGLTGTGLAVNSTVLSGVAAAGPVSFNQ